MKLHVDYVAGVSPAKWLRVWAERRPDAPVEARRVDERAQLDALRAGEADLAFVRLPVDDEGLHRIPLWDEQPFAVLPKDHELAEAASFRLEELAGLPRAPHQDDPAMLVELVAAGTGIAVLPQSLARLHHRRDVVARPVVDAPPTRIALVWRIDRDDAVVQDFVGVVRGRTAQSSRGAEEAEPAPAPAKTAKPARRGGAPASAPRRPRTPRGTGRRSTGGKGTGKGKGKGKGKGRR